MKLIKRKPKIKYEDDELIDSKILKIRGIKEENHLDFIIPESKKYISNPYALKNMDIAVDKAIDAIVYCKNIVIYGDPDCDGVCSTQLIYGYLSRFECNVSYIMNQREEGHGVIVEKIPSDTQLLIIVDSSTNSTEQCKQIQDMGIDIIILDHHQLEKDFDNIYATVVNPYNCKYKNKHLSGSAVCYQFARAMDIKLQERNSEFMPMADDFVDLACVGLVGDMMDLMNMENRHIVYHGLATIHTNSGNEGLYYLFKSLGKHYKPTATDISFYVSPCINAVVRLDDIYKIMNLFTESDESIIKQLTKEIIEINEQRKILVADIYKSIEDKLGADNIEIVDMTNSGYKRGLFGLLANKISRDLQKPCFVGIESEGVFSGSGRGYSEDMDLRLILDNTGMFEKVAGHDNAFGVYFKVEDKNKIIEWANKELKEVELSTLYDMELKYEELDEDELMLIDNMSMICGKGFEAPRFLIRQLFLSECKKIGDNKHTKLTIKDEMDLNIMKFNTEESIDKYENACYINVVGSVGLNTFGFGNYKKTTKQVLSDYIECVEIEI